MKELFGGVYAGKRVLVTGHTGFKGSWLTSWLSMMGARVVGYSLEASTQPSHFELLPNNIVSCIGDINDTQRVEELFQQYKPEIVFHLAAQALVRDSYADPITTYETNVMGTLRLYEACRAHNVQAIVSITSDKVYENKEWAWGYRENDSLGGHDPYSSSKGCMELLSASYRASYFSLDAYQKSHNTLLATCRAGNVIGGGDWAKDRLIPDAVVAASKSEKTVLRNPLAVRPWQHVLEPLSGYLLVGQKLLSKEKEFACTWNFGPNEQEDISVKEALQKMHFFWKKIAYEIESSKNQPHETQMLRLDSSKAHKFLQWHPVWSREKGFERTIQWYKNFYEQESVMTYFDLEEYVMNAKEQNICWAVCHG
ncbi:MAG: CDP-glucose 4,6-dehydratase [Sulfurimonadaceae bacterium]